MRRNAVPADVEAWARRVALVALAACVLVAMLMTSAQMSALRVGLPPLSQAMSRIERIPLPFDMEHVLFFALCACVARWLLPAARWRSLLLGFLVVAIGTELLQYFTHGRTPRLSDARDDMVGVLAGLALASLPRVVAGTTRWQMTASQACLLLGVGLLPFQQWPLAQLWGFPLLPSDAAFVLALALRGLAWAGGRAPVRLTGFHAAIAAYLAWMLVTVWLLSPLRTAAPHDVAGCPLPMPGFGRALAKWVGLCWLGMLALLAADAASQVDARRRVSMAWLAGAAVAAVVAWCVAIAFYVGDAAREFVAPLLSHYGSLPPGPYPRIRGVFANANMFGLFLLLSVAVALHARDAGWWDARRLRGFLMLVSLPLLATASPAISATLLLLVVHHARVTDTEGWMTRPAVLLAAGLVALNLIGLSINPAAPFAEPSVRTQLWIQAVAAWQAAPWAGQGLGSPAIQLFYTAPDGQLQLLDDAHNTWLNLAVQGGILAPVLFAMVVATACWTTRDEPAKATLQWGILLAAGCLCLSGSFEDARVLWILLGLSAGVGSLAALPVRQQHRRDG